MINLKLFKTIINITIIFSSFITIIYGCNNYVIRPGDTFYDLSIRYKTTIHAIATANPTVNPAFLVIGI
jgi:g-D-glutamyl-meso-diaminopimelate peptidase